MRFVSADSTGSSFIRTPRAAATKPNYGPIRRHGPFLRIAIRECPLPVRKRLQFGLDQAARIPTQGEAKVQIPDLELRALEPTQGAFGVSANAVETIFRKRGIGILAIAGERGASQKLVAARRSPEACLCG